MIGADPVPETLAARAAHLFSDYRDGDQAKMSELVTLVSPILWHTARAQRLDRGAAEDVIQTTWLSLVRSAATIADPRAVLQWLIVTTRRESWRVMRRDDRVEPQEFDNDAFVASSDDIPEELVLRTEGDSRLWQHIEQLPERCKALLRVIAHGDKPDYGAIARSLGMPVGSIGPTRGRCLAKLRDQLTRDPGWEFS